MKLSGVTSSQLTWENIPNNQLLHACLPHYPSHCSFDKGWGTLVTSGEFLQTWMIVNSRADSTSD